MTYAGNDFWAQYADYVEECLPRHYRMFSRLLGEGVGPVLDLGCGKIMEGRRLAGARTYLGVDQDPADHPDTRRCDYRDLSELERVTKNAIIPTTILSMFSVELTASYEDNHLFYRRLLHVFPSVDRVVSVGFYYNDHRQHDLTVGEVGGLVSYQSIGPMPVMGLSELRAMEPGPSKLFGQSPVEVWRVLTRGV